MTLLSERIKQLRLRPDAPYPSELADGKQLIREWRHEQRLHLVRSDDSVRRRDSGDSGSDFDMGDESA